MAGEDCTLPVIDPPTYAIVINGASPQAIIDTLRTLGTVTLPEPALTKGPCKLLELRLNGLPVFRLVGVIK